MNLWRLIRFHYIRLKRLQGDPEYLAVGTAIGVFVGMTPTLPLQTPLIVVLSFFTRSSVVAALISSWIVCNPLTFLPLYYCSALVGNMLTPFSIHPGSIHMAVIEMQNAPSAWQAFQIFGNLGYETMITLLAGGLIIAFPCGIISYWPARHFFRKLQQRKSRVATN